MNHFESSSYSINKYFIFRPELVRRVIRRDNEESMSKIDRRPLDFSRASITVSPNFKIVTKCLSSKFV